ncbi:MAG: hypothetical protein ABIS07_04400, partial [Dokdonella sp.]
FRALQLPPQVELDIAEHGGHCGFISDLSLRSFTDDYIAERMRVHLAGHVIGSVAQGFAATA